ncbi:hypothetical protein BJ912DRAFT_866014 [Pholiota molesta]|nr:hypothetical protein BJ912DRAFT_866014 [Pholiota molesta]
MPYLSLTELLNPQNDADAVEAVNQRHAQPQLQLCTPPPPTADAEDRFDIRLNRVTVLSKLKTFADTAAYVEYPETTATGPVGYLFRQDVNNWRNPLKDFAYSLGQPMGRTREGKEVFSDLLIDEGGEQVPCSKTHATCHGVKICPAADRRKWAEPHYHASVEDVRNRMRQQREGWLEGTSPRRDVFQKTAAFIAALRKLGCSGPRREETVMNDAEISNRKALAAHQASFSRGYLAAEERCEGRILLEYDHTDQPFLRCEHYGRKHNRDHYVQYIDDSYDIDYLEAYFYEDADELDRIEGAARGLGYGPLAECQTVMNCSSQRAYCPHDHRGPHDDAHHLRQFKLQNMPCNATYHLYEPLPQFRLSCPWSLVICRGSHPHPVPIPQKTPPLIQKKLRQVLESLDDDLADLTPRRFLRHPILKTFLSSYLRHIKNASLCDLHKLPYGTGWEGVCYELELQEYELPLEEHYIRQVIQIPHDGVALHEEDEPSDFGQGNTLRIVVCMTPEASRRMAQAQYLQSDVGFKRVEGFYEFEIGILDRNSNMSVTLCRVFSNRQTAFAHYKIFEAIDNVIEEDTHRYLQWRHIHVGSADVVLQWTGDQHGGQAKGLGLYLQSVSQRPELKDKFDLHEPDRLISLLSPYEHLHRLFRLCTVHVKRNIRKVAVSDDVRNLMRSLICLEHDNWEGTLEKIVQLGGKAASDWVHDKNRSKFAFEAICWEKSHIPLSIWKAGDSNSNLIETAHSDVNREGIHCTLLGGIKKGRAFDAMKLKSLQATENLGIRPSYASGHISVNATKNLKRKCKTSVALKKSEPCLPFLVGAHHRALENADEKIIWHNEQLKGVHEKLLNAQQEAFSNPARSVQIKLNQASLRYKKQVEFGKGLVHTGSGNVGILLPENI